MRLSGYFYRCSAGESFDSIALDVYGDEKYAAELLGANPALGETMIFQGGEELALPIVETEYRDTAGNRITAAPWKE